MCNYQENTEHSPCEKNKTMILKVRFVITNSNLAAATQLPVTHP